MKKTITLLAAVFAFCVMAEPLNLQMPFKKGRKTPIAWWRGKGTLVEADGVNAVALEKGKGIMFKNAFPGKAGDKIVYEITFKRTAGSVSLRIGTWSKEGWIGEMPSYLKGGKDFSVAKGEIVLKDAAKPDKKAFSAKSANLISVFRHTMILPALSSKMSRSKLSPKNNKVMFL